MEAPKNRWKGLGAIVVARQSDDKDGTASTAAQLDHMKHDFDRVGMRFVDNVMLEGVAGSAPARITEMLEKLFKRKKQANDFDVIAWQVEDRASRGGGEFGMWLEHEAKRHGLLVYFAGDEGATVPYAPVIRVAKYEAAKEVSVSNGRRSAQGQTWAQKEGFFRTAGPTPIGCDRLYCGSDNRPKFVMHNLLNGLQEQRDWITGNVIGTFGTVGTKSRNRLKKQRNEYSLLVPGDREQRRIVRVIFYLRYKRGWRGLRIADYLNRLRVPSPKGKEWSQRQVQLIYERESYTGVSFNDRTYSGRFFRRDKVMGFVALDRDACELAMKKTFSPKLRPMEDWDRIDQPYMYNFLPRDVRDLAIAAQAQMWCERSDPTRPRKKPNAHPASEFLLSDRLRAIQDDGALVGTMSGPADHKVPYYRHRRSKRGHLKGSIYNNLIPAKPLHEALVKLIAEVLLQAPELRARLAQHLQEHRAAVLQDQPDVPRLEAERDELRQQISLVMKVLKGAALAEAAEELQRLGERRNAIEETLANIRGTMTRDERPIGTVLDEAVRVLADDSRRLLSLSIEPLRGFVNQMIMVATVDMETKAVEFMLTLPTWALLPAPKMKISWKSAEIPGLDDLQALCPASTPRSQAGGWTQKSWRQYRCEYRWKRGSSVEPPCYECHRAA